MDKIAGGNAPGKRPATESDPERVESGRREAKFASRNRGLIDPCRVGGSSVAHSGGVAPGYYLVPLQGENNRRSFSTASKSPRFPTRGEKSGLRVAAAHEDIFFRTRSEFNHAVRETSYAIMA